MASPYLNYTKVGNTALTPLTFGSWNVDYATTTVLPDSATLTAADIGKVINLYLSFESETDAQKVFNCAIALADQPRPVRLKLGIDPTVEDTSVDFTQKSKGRKVSIQWSGTSWEVF